MDATNIRTVPTNYGYKWLLAAWTLAKKHYGDCLIVAIIGLVSFIILGRLGPIGTVIIAICSPILAAGCLVCTKRWLNGETAVLKDFFQVFQQPEKIKQLAPLLAFQVALSIMSAGSIFFVNLGGLFYLPPLFILIVNCLTAFALPLMYLKGLYFGEAISLSVKAVINNLATVLVSFGFTVIVVTIAALLLAIPLFFMVMPAMVVISYIVFATIFENLDLQTILPKVRPTLL